MAEDVRERDTVSIGGGKYLWFVGDVWPDGLCTLLGRKDQHGRRIKQTVHKSRLTVRYRPGVNDQQPGRIRRARRQ